MSAQHLGDLRMELKEWRQEPIRATWTSGGARYPGDLPVRIMGGNEELWRTEPVGLPDAAACLRLYDAERPPAA